MNELVLVQSKAAREEFVNRVDILQKVSQLSLLPDDLHATVENVATYYNVQQAVIKMVISNHRDELNNDGLKVIRGEDLKEFASKIILPAKIRSLTLIPRRAILRIGMLLRDSEVAKQVRTHLLQMEHEARQQAVTAEPTTNPAPELAVKADTLRWLAANTKMLLEVLPDGENRVRAVANLYAFVGIPYPTLDEPVEPSNGSPLTLVEPVAKWYSCQAIASQLGLFTIHKNPHAQLVGAIIRTFGELEPGVDWKPVMLNREEKPDILASQYSERVTRLVAETLKKSDWPGMVRVMGRNYTIAYRDRTPKENFAVIG